MNFQSLIYVASADTSLGRIDKASLSQQTLMELLVSGFTKKKERIFGYADDIPDISEWMYVEFDDTNTITILKWGHVSVAGSIDLQWIPFSVRVASLEYNRLQGTVDLTCLPDGLEVLNLGHNEFEGTVDLTKLPPAMINLCLYENNFVGETDFSQFPKAFAYLDIEDTSLEGKVFDFSGILMIRNCPVKDMRRK